MLRQWTSRSQLRRDAAPGETNDIDITIVIPAFNEQRRLPATLDRLIGDMEDSGCGRWELIVVDDGSTDATAQVLSARESQPGLTWTSLAGNKGKGAALLAGAAMARHEVVAFLDADLPVSTGTLLDMARRTADADLVLGSRRLSGSSTDPCQPLLRRVGAHGFRVAVRMLGYETSSDPQCGVKVFRREPLAPVLAELACERFAFDVELIVRARRRGVSVIEVPVAWRHVPGSSLRPFRDAVVTLRDLRNLRRNLSVVDAHLP